MISVSQEDFDAVFPNRLTKGYIMVDSIAVPELSELTVSLWAETDTCSEKHTLLSYSTGDGKTEILLRLEQKVLGQSRVCKLSVTMKDVEYVAFCC